MADEIHLVLAVLLVISHSVFFFRGIFITRKSIKPVLIDKLARFLSHLLLPVTVLSGIPALSAANRTLFPHLFFGILPVVSVPVVQLFRIAVKKRKELPWILPLLNLVLIIAALFTGLWRSL